MCLFPKICSLIVLFGVLESEGFTYEDPNEWGEQVSECNGDSQSPIDIPYSQGLDTFESKKKLSLVSYDTYPETMTLINDGHTIKVSFTWPRDAILPYATGGPLGNDKYVIAQFQFHWGSSDDSGGEHTFDGKSAALGVQFFHYNDKYDSFSDALGYDDGLAIVGGSYYPDAYSSSKGIEEIWKVFNSSIKDGDERNVDPFPLYYFEAIWDAEEYVTYHGSLTTPPCSEIVVWILAVDKFSITTEELEKLRSTVELYDGDDHNYRPVQPLNGRQVYIAEFI